MWKVENIISSIDVEFTCHIGYYDSFSKFKTLNLQELKVIVSNLAHKGSQVDAISSKIIIKSSLEVIGHISGVIL